ncbi:ribonuclease III [Candidatus Microgenomates bacterium]|nr:ribonuclease III [Candidatus Microgenomates bacterium]
MLKTALSDFEKILGITFKDKQLLIESLTHRSYLNEDTSADASNERLEFLGDSVLSLLTSTELFKRFKNYPEGKLTNLRSTLVRTQTLGKISLKLGYGTFLRISKGEERSGGRDNQSILADTFEAVLGAIYLDQGLKEAEKFLIKHLFSDIDQLINDKANFDYKSK